MGFQYAIINKETKETVGTFSFAWIKDCITVKENLCEMLSEVRKLIDKCKFDIEEINRFQESVYPEAKKKILEEINETGNLLELLKKIDHLNEEYTKKTFTFYREDEIYYAQRTLDKLETFETWLLEFQPSEKYFGELSF